MEFVRGCKGSVVNKSEGVLVGIRGPVLVLVSESVSSIVVITAMVSRVSITITGVVGSSRIVGVVRSTIRTGIVRVIVVVSSFSVSIGFGLGFSLGFGLRFGLRICFSINPTVIWGIKSGDTVVEVLIIVEGARVVGVSCVWGTEGVSWVGGPYSVSSIGVGMVIITTITVIVILGLWLRLSQSSHNAKGC